MAAIEKRTNKAGAITYRAKIRIHRDGSMIHQESRTFDKKKSAEQWARNRESLLDDPRELKKVQFKGITVGDVLRRYKDDFAGIRSSGRSKNADLDRLMKSPIAALDAIQLTQRQVIGHLMDRLQIDGVKPQTANNDLIWIRAAFKTIRATKGWPLPVEELADVATVAKDQRLVARSGRRDRRPTLAELDRLLDYYQRGDRRQQLPMVDLVLFALFSSRRQDEICRIQWDDLDTGGKRVLVRKMKHPREKIDTWVSLPPLAWALIERQPRTAAAIFPYNGRSVSAAMTRACKVLGLDDLRFHDLRHECASWLFELGWNIPAVAQVTGHRAWSSLQRYTHLQDHGVKDKFAGWKWRADLL